MQLPDVPSGLDRPAEVPGPPAEDPRVSRRSVLRRAAVGTAAVTVVGTAGTALVAAPAAAAVTVSPASLVPADGDSHLLRRATFGPTPAARAEIARLGPVAWLDRQLNPASVPDPVCDAVLARLEYVHADIPTVRRAVSAGRLKRGGWEPMQQLGYAALARAAWSERQLYEVMVDFWGNHLNVTCPSSEVWDSRPDYDRAVIRRYALGRFADLLKASAHHPAMLSYLDNRSSTRWRPNENYGRELLELHTVGLVHTEADVQNAARLLTGMTVDNATGLYRYQAAWHATGAVRVLGFSHGNKTEAGGQAAAMALLDYLAMHPATARRIARKLCVRFVADDPPAPLVERLASVYLTQRSAIAPVLRALFTSAEFAASVGAKVRTPLEDLAATVRILGLAPETPETGFTALRSLYWMVDELGQGPMRWGPPDGYPDVASAWASPSGYVSRWNSHLNLAAGWWPKQLTRPASLVAHLVPALPDTYGGLVDALTDRLLGMRVTDAHRAALVGFLGKQPSSRLRATDGAVRWLFPYLVALVLDSPYFWIR